METIPMRFSKEADFRQTAECLVQSTKERLNDPTARTEEPRADSEAGMIDIAVGDASLHSILFPELQQATENASRVQQAQNELPEMRAHRGQRKSFMKSEIALSWAESLKSNILWIDGNDAFTRADFNASFVSPLLLVGESNFEKFITIRYYCEQQHGEAEQYLVLMQALLSQLLHQYPSAVQRHKPSITRDKTSTTEGLWALLMELLLDVEVQCVFIVIGGLDHLANDSSGAEDLHKKNG